MPLLVAVTIALLAVRLWAAAEVGFGDSEALYASWALHPQPAYLDHPGIVGVVARAIGAGAAPSPLRAHLVTTVIATALPWQVLGTARLAGAAARPAAIAAVVVAVVPELAVGLFALTPDLVLAPLWLATIALAIVGLRPAREAPPSSGRGREERRLEPRRVAALLAAGLLAGIAAAAKVSGLLLVLALVVVHADAARSRDQGVARIARSIWPWAGIAAGLVVTMPIVLYEARLGFPMLRHRFVDTQHGAGLAVANAGQLLGGQLLYLSPVVAWLAYVVARDLVRTRAGADTAGRILFFTFAIPLVPLVILCLWSPVAEPHWIAPALLALPLHAARRPGALGGLRPRVVRAGAAIAAAITALAHAWVLVPASARILPDSADPKLDIANELHGWPEAVAVIRAQLATAATPFDPEGHDVVVLGPHWTVCAQLHVALVGVRVGCATPMKDDFDRWFPRDDWRRADDVLWVTDNRFPGDGAEQLPAHVRVSHRVVPVVRGGRTVRTFHLYQYARLQHAQGSGEPADGIVLRPASRISARSSSADGFGVVRSFSP